ncbi:histidine-containing phosphotransfer protein 4-like [Corylus avellana]|nr:histidine-containing phosphotransfer protein 4-like [Corylus avellana]
MLEDDNDPNFVDTVASSYFSQTPTDIHAVEQILYAIPVDPAKVETILFKFKGASSSFGANKVTIEINKMIDCLRRGDMEGCKAGLPILKQEFDTLKNKLGAYLKLLRQDKPSSSSTGANY